MYKVVILSLALGTAGSYSVPADRYQVGSKNGEDFYSFEVNGATDEFYETQLAHWGNHMCPNGYRVTKSELSSVRHSALRTDKWYDITIACPAT